MEEDLSTEVFLNGDSIYQAKSKEEWKDAIINKIPAWCYTINEQGQKGKFYNIYVLKDERGIVPKNWRIPNNYDWNILSNFINNTNETICENCWVHIPKDINSFGFNGFKNGYRYKYGQIYSSNKNIFYWSRNSRNSNYRPNSNYTIATTAIGSELTMKFGSIIRLPIENFGLQIRCIKTN